MFGVESLVYRRVKNDGDQTLSIHKSVFAGFCAGAVQSVIVCPMELIKIRMQNQFIGRLPQHSNSKLLRFKNPSHDETKKKIKTMNTKIETIKKKMNEAIIKKVHRIHYSGPLEIAQNIVKTEGIKGMFRGWWITLLREVPQFGIYFGTYAWMRQYFATINNISPEDLGLLHLSLAGGVTGVVTWCWYPVDVIKSRLQYNGVIGGGNYNGIADCVRRSYQSEGISVFMKGFQPTIIRGALNGFVTLPVFTVVMQFLHSQYV